MNEAVDLIMGYARARLQMHHAPVLLRCGFMKLAAADPA